MTFLLYLILQIDKISAFILITGLIVLVVVTVRYLAVLEGTSELYASMDRDKYIKSVESLTRIRKTMPTHLAIVILLISFFVFMPSSKNLMILYAVPKIVESGYIEKGAKASVNLLLKKTGLEEDEDIQEFLKELKGEK